MSDRPEFSTCRQCRHVLPTAQGWECHRYPPALLYAPQSMAQLKVSWPDVRGDEFCGEWAAAEPKPEKTTPADMLDVAVQNGRLNERGDVVAWLTEAQFHVVGQDEVAVILKLREQFRRGLHERRKS